MAAILIGGQEAGLLDTSLNLLDRNDRSSEAEVGSGEQLAVNVASGNLILSREDTYLPSLGDDFELIRTYNSRGELSDTGEPDWRLSQTIQVIAKRDSDGRYYQVKYGDGSLFEFRKDDTGSFVSTDGAGAFETLRRIGANKAVDGIRTEVTRADQTVLGFDNDGNLLRWEDPNGVAMTYKYRNGQLIRVEDDNENIFYFYYDAADRLTSVQDNSGATLVEYRYDKNGRLSAVVDRNGDVTGYRYAADGSLRRIDLPTGFDEPARRILFSYTSVNVRFPDGGPRNSKVLTQMTDAEGNVTTFDYAFVLGEKNVYLGGTTTVTDASGAQMAYTYDERGYITKVVDRGGYETSYSYDAEGNLTSVTDRNDKTSTFTYDARGNLLTSTDNSGNVTTYTYTDFNKLATVEAPEGGVTVLSYDGNQNLIRQVDPGGDVTEFSYDALGNQTQRVVYLDKDDLLDEAKQQVTQYFYDAFGNQIRSVDALGGETRSTFDRYGNLTQFVDANGGVYLYTYDGDNRLLTLQDPQGNIERSVYDSVGNRLSFRDGNGRLTVYVYDKNNRLISSTVSGYGDTPRTTTRAYDVVGNGTEVTDGEGNTTRYVYNARREVLEVITPQVVDKDGNPVTYRTAYVYDGEGQVLTINDNNGNVTTYTYTPVGLVETETNARGLLTEYHYDRNLNVLQIASGLAATSQNPKVISRQTHFRYDAEDQLEEIEDAEGNVTRYDYDAPGNVISVVDGEENETRYEYDLNNRLVREILPADDQGVEHTIVRSYDANGNEVSVTNENGQTRHLGYDELNRRIRLTDENGITTEFEYDRADNLTRVIIGGEDNDEAQITTFLYNVFDELVGEIDAVGNALIHSNAELYQNMRTALNSRRNVEQLTVLEREGLLDLFTTRYTYDRAGNRTSYTDSEGRVTAFEYDDMNRLVLQTDALGGTRSFRYDGNGNLVWEQDERGKITTWSHDQADQVVRTENAEGGVQEYGYDIFGNITSQEESGNTVLGDTQGTNQLVGRSSTYVYDKNNLLLTETNINPVGANRTTVYKYDKVGNRTEVIDARGNKTEYEYDARNRNVKIIDPLLQEAVFEYDGVGNQIRILDPRGNASAFAYDPGNRLISFTDGEGRRTEYEYDVRGNQITITTGIDAQFNPDEDAPEADRSDRQVTVFEYDAENNLRAVVDATGARSSFDFDRVYNEVSETDARGNTTRREFDALNREVKVTDALGNETYYAYDALGNTLSVTDARGFTTAFEYDGNSNLIIERDALGTETHYENDGFGNTISITQAAVSLELDEDTGEPLTKPRKTTFYYDSFGNLVREVNPVGDDKTYTYDKLNNVETLTDELDRTTQYLYDENSQLTLIIDALGGETRFGYDSSGNRNRTVDAEGRVSTNYYNGNDELFLSIDALGFATSYEYDANGNVVAATEYAVAVGVPADPNDAANPSSPPTPATNEADRTTRFRYDPVNRLEVKVDPLGGEFTYTYDAVGNQVAVIDENDNTTGYAFDALNRLVEIKDPLLEGQTEAQRGTQTFTYDAQGNLATETDQRGNTTRYVYDELDRQVEMVDPLGGRMTSTYDAVGNQLTETDERGNSFTFEYDLLDRLVTRTNSELDDSGAPGVTSWAYDKVGNRTSLINEENEERLFVYDALNRLTRATDADGNFIHYAFDKVGNETERRNGGKVGGVDMPDGYSTEFKYDALNQVIERDDAAGGVRELTYDAFGNLISESNEDGDITLFRYDLNNRLKETEDPEGGIVVFGYDAAGNKTSETDERLNVTTFVYDALNRVTRQTDPLGNSLIVGYDPVGNAVFETDKNTNTATKVYDENNRLTAFLSAEGYLSVYEYDAAGNETVRREYTRQYATVSGPDIPHPDDEARLTISTYNTLNQLTSSTDAAGLTTYYEYDKAGRLTRTFQGSPPAATVSFLAANGSSTAVVLTTGAGSASVEYDSEGRVVRQTDANGVITAFELDNKGNVIRKTEALGLADERVTTFTYDNLSRLTRETTGVGTDIGTTITYTYDAADRLETRITAGEPGVIGDRIERFEYDEDGRLTAEINGVGLRNEYFYDAADNLIRAEYDVVRAPGTDPDIPVAGRFNKQYDYDANNRIILEVDGEGVATKYEYDANGNKTRTIQAYLLPGESSPPSDPLRALTNPDDPQRVTEYRYDGENRLVEIIDPEGRSTTYRYDVDGNRTAIVDAKGMETRNEFDSMGRIHTNTVDAGGANGGVRTTNTYDSRGNVLSTSVGFADGSDEPRVTYYEYDAMDQLVKVTDPEGFATRFTYDSFGNQTSIVLGLYEGERDGSVDADKLSLARPQATYFVYDELGRLVLTIDGEGNAVELEYDVHGNQIAQRSGVKVTAADLAAYADAGSDPVLSPYVGITASDDVQRTSLTRFTYDLNGELLTKATEGDVPGQDSLVEITRDKLGRQTRIRTLQSGTGSNPLSDKWVEESFTYDSWGRVLTSMDSYQVVTAYEYDALGNVLTLTKAAGAETVATSTPDRITRSTYDRNSNLKTFTDAEGGTIAFFYDEVGNMVRSVDANGGTTINYFNARNQLVGTVDTDRVYTRYDKDALDNLVTQTVFANRVTAVAGTPPTVTADALNDRVVRQTFNGNNKRTTETAPNGKVLSFEFDSAGRLLSRTESVDLLTDSAALARTTDSSAKVLRWSYDASGRLTSFSNLDGVVEEYEYDSSGNRVTERVVPATGTAAMANGAVDPVRTTTFTYDSSNRLKTQSIAGSTQTLEYDLAGNITAKIDALGARSETRYDLNNRADRIVDALGQTVRLAYDAVGNLIQTTDARGLIYTIAYDRNNRVTEETAPRANYFELDLEANNDGVVPSPSPTGTTAGFAKVQRQYDAVGNLVKITNVFTDVSALPPVDEVGFATTRWYDASQRVIAEIDGNGVLRTYTYNAFGELETVTVDKQFAGSLEPSAPVPSAVAPIVVQNTYDNMGNIVLTRYPEVAVTRLNADATALSSVVNVAPTEQSFFDAFGNLVQSINRRGDSEYSFVDRLGQQVALVDADGFMIQSEYDSLGNLIQQRKYESKVTVSMPGVVPAGGGEVNTVDRVFDEQNRLVSEVSAGVKTVNGDNVRVTTAYAYDEAGNLIRRTLASGTDQEQSEYYYYDAIGQRTGVVTANRILATFAYDQNGNLTQQKRFITPLSTGLDLAAATSTTASLQAAVAKVTADDQTTTYAYNNVNLLSTQTSVMGSVGGSNDIVTRFAYDQYGNMTRRTDGDGFVSYIDYDANGNILLTISPNGSRSFVEYNTSGQKTRAWTGGTAATSASPVTGIGVSLDNGSLSGIDVTWTSPGEGAYSWVAWDTQSLVDQESAYGPDNTPSDEPGGAGDGNDGRYRNATGQGAGGVTIPLDGVAAGETVYFRVVTNDNGNLSWSEERAVFVPARIEDLSVRQEGSNFVVRAQFNGAVTAPMIQSQSGTVAPTALTSIGGNAYEVTIAGGTDPEDLLLSFSWSSGSKDFSTTAARLLAAPGEHINQGNGFFSWELPNGGEAPFNSATADDLIILNGVSEYDRGVDFPTAGGVVFPISLDSSRVGETIQFNPPATGEVNYDLYYGERVVEGHELDIVFTDTQTFSVTPGAVIFNTATPPVPVSQNFTTTWASDDDDPAAVQAAISIALGGAENARIAGDVMLAHRPAGSDGNFSEEKAMTESSGTWSADLDMVAGQAYDLKIYYLESDGAEVIVEWRRVTAPAESAPESTNVVLDLGDAPEPEAPRIVFVGSLDFGEQFSFRVLGAERGSTVSGSGADRVIEVGTYTGPLGAGVLGLNLSPVQLAGSPGFAPADYQNIYFTEIIYNDLGIKIASNEDTGVWRIYGVDEAGNQVMTGSYGTRALADADGNDFGSSRNSFARFDKRNNETKSVGVSVGGQSAVTITSYDYAGRVKTLREPGASIAKEFDYDGVGNLIRETDSLGNPTLYTYDRLGNRVRSSRLHDDRGSASDVFHTQVFVYTYGESVNANRLTSSYFVGKENETVDYTYDGFGRRLSQTNGKNEAISVAYDQRGRVVRLTDAMGEVTRYSYDKRGNQTWVQDAENNYFGRAYDSMGQLTHEYAFTASPGSLTVAQSRAAAGHSSLVVKRTIYDLWNNKQQTIDAEGRSEYFSYAGFGRVTRSGDTNFTYDVFGNQVGETSRFGKNITRTYDAAGRLTAVNDTATNTYTFYQYDSAGRRTFERLRKGGNAAANDVRVKTYTYDAEGQLLSWNDAKSGLGATYRYFNDGNIKSITENVPGTDPVTSYTFDSAGRVLSAGNEVFTYDSAGRRATSRVGSNNTTTYTYNANGWITEASGGSSSATGGDDWTWKYDKVGNVTEVDNGDKNTKNTYDDRYLITVTNSDGQLTTSTFDKSGRTVSTVVVDDGNTFTYTYAYFDQGQLNAGLQRSVTGSGSEVQTSSSTSSYDVNGNLLRVNLGKGDEDDRAEVNEFSYDNDGNIIEANRLPGKGSREITKYLYANGNPVGEYVSTSDPTINEGNYATVINIDTGLGDDATAFPGTTITQHTVAAGDTLRGLADRYYGSPDLWYVIADANGLTGAEALQPGSRLVVPNTVENAYQNADTHALYKEGDIIGSQLPNLASPPPPPKDNCAVITAIVLIVVVAIAAVAITIVTVGAAAPAAAAALGFTAGSVGAVLVGVAVGAVIGAAIAFAASVITQGILIGFGLQESFDWNAVAADTVAGAFGGAAAGLGAAVSAASKATTLLKTVNVVGQATLEASGEAASQAIQNDGKIDNPWLVVAAGAGGAFGAVGDSGSRTAKAAESIDDTTAAARKAAGTAFESVDEIADGARAAREARLDRAVDAADDAIRASDDLASLRSAVDASLEAREARRAGTAARRFDTEVFSAVFKAEWSKAGKSAVVAGTAAKKLAKAGAGLVKAPFKALRAGGEAIIAGARALRRGGLGELAAVAKLGARSSATRLADSLRGAFKAVKRAPQTFSEFRSQQRILRNLDDVSRAGTIAKTKFTKTVRFFDEIDGQKVARYKTVVRDSAKTAFKGKSTKTIRVLDDATGTIKYQQIQRLSVATPSKFARYTAKAKSGGSSAAQSVFDVVKKPFVAIREFKQSGTVAKLETTKIVRSFDTVDGKRVEKFTEVVRASRRTGIKTANFKTQRILDPAGIPGRLGQTKMVIVARKNPAGTSALAKYVSKPIKNAASSAKTSIIDAYNTGKVAKAIGFIGGKATTLAPMIAGEKRSDGIRRSPGRFMRTAGSGGKLSNGIILKTAVGMFGNSKFGFLNRGPLAGATQWLDTATATIGLDLNLTQKSQDAQPFADAFITRSDPPVLDDRNARTTYADLHARQYKWIPVDWASVAAGTTTQVFSPFPVDRSSGVGLVLASNRMVSGQVGEFDQSQIVAFSERSVGGVDGDISRVPSEVG